eukprot:4182684-Pleurochrysis_carterae.AAC.1
MRNSYTADDDDTTDTILREAAWRDSDVAHRRDRRRAATVSQQHAGHHGSAASEPTALSKSGCASAYFRAECSCLVVVYVLQPSLSPVQPSLALIPIRLRMQLILEII